MNNYFVEVVSSDKLVGLDVKTLSDLEKHKLSLIASKSFKAVNDESAKEHAREYSEGIALPRSITGNSQASIPANILLYRINETTKERIFIKI